MLPSATSSAQRDAAGDPLWPASVSPAAVGSVALAAARLAVHRIGALGTLAGLGFAAMWGVYLGLAAIRRFHGRARFLLAAVLFIEALGPLIYVRLSTADTAVAEA